MKRYVTRLKKPYAQQKTYSVQTFSGRRHINNPVIIILAIIMIVAVTTAVIISAANPKKVRVDEAGYQYGLDISEHNGKVDLKTAKQDGKNFVMIRLGYYNHLDKNFLENVKSAYKAKMYYGVYLYSYARTEQEAQIEAEFVLKTLSKLGKYSKYFVLPVAYDIEDEKLANISKSNLTAQAELFCEAVKSEGYVPMIYANADWYNNHLNLDRLVKNGYKLWYAYYQDGSPDFKTPVTILHTDVKPDMWQYEDDSDKYAKLDKNVIYNIESLL